MKKTDSEFSIFHRAAGDFWLISGLVFALVLGADTGWGARLDLSRAVNQALCKELNGAAQDLLAENGLVAQPSQEIQFYSIYQRLAKSHEPMFITTDCALHLFHILYDHTLRELETKYLYDDLAGLTQALLEYELKVLRRTADAHLKARLLDNIGYLGVAASLLELEPKLPKEVLPRVRQELKLIADHQGSTKSPLMGYNEDYSQYVPRGHYTRNVRLQRYFKAMMWYGRIGFALKPGNTAAAIALGRRLTAQALLLADALRQVYVGTETGLTVWNRIYEVTTFLVGRSDDLNAEDYYEIAEEVFGDLPLSKAVTDQKRLDRFIAAALARPGPKIVSQVVPDTLQPERVTKGFRFMGQRYIPDSYVFQELVYNRVGTQLQPRLMPKGLDVMAVLGSERARQILKTVYQEDQYLNYEQQLQKLRAEFEQLTTEEWNQNIYFGWLYALKLQLEPVAENRLLPEFCFVPAYADKCLVTACGSWAQLRHDTILYAKQSYTMFVTAVAPQPEPEPRKPVVYVEPKPKVFDQIAVLAGQMINRLAEARFLSEEVRERLSRLKSLATLLSTLAEQEIAGRTPDEAGLAEAAGIGKIMEDLAEFPSEGPYSDADKTVETVADVHTDPNRQLVLEAAVGKPLVVYAFVPFEGRRYIATGAMFSYYEFTRHMSERMTDEQWQGLTAKPPMPVWTESFVR